jgi:O-antigen/teichoic acid export membrane protein
MRTQLTWTLITELAVLAAGILVLRLAAQFLGAAGFGEYTLSRRAIGLLYLPLVMGLGVAAPRYVAIARAGALPGYAANSFAVASLTVGLLPTVIVIALMNLNPAGASTVLFGNASMTHLVPAATLALGGLTIHGLVYAVFRGGGQMQAANLMQFLNYGVIPVAAFLVVPHHAAAVLTATGAAWIVTSGIALLALLVRATGHTGSQRSVTDHLRLLLRFGIPRIPGEFALVGLFAFPALIALRAHGVVVAGQLSAALSLLTIVSSVFAPVGLVLLPRASAQAAMGDLAGLQRLVGRMLGGGIILVIIAVAIGELLIPVFVPWYFGPAFIVATPVFQACLVGAIPYVVYVLLRNVLDALDVRALNSRNLVITLVLLVTLCLLNTDIMSMAFSLLTALTLLSILSLRDTHSRLGRRALATATGAPGLTATIV